MAITMTVKWAEQVKIASPYQHILILAYFNSVYFNPQCITSMSSMSSTSYPLLPYQHAHALIDTHTHFDVSIFDADREQQVLNAMQAGVRHLVLVGYVAKYFERMRDVQQQINQQVARQVDKQSATQAEHNLQAHVAYGLHPFYIRSHDDADLDILANELQHHDCLALGEIGLDTFSKTMKQPEHYQRQVRFFQAQLQLAQQHQLPIMLHIRKAHADALKILKQFRHQQRGNGGIAHSFSGAQQEAKAFVKLGFKLGVTGQVSNPNAKKLHRAIKTAVDYAGLECLVIETDCPDMTPLPCQRRHHHHDVNKPNDVNKQPDRNVPANLPYVLLALSELLSVPVQLLAERLWQNSVNALNLSV